jgi:hypothetical protein
MGEPCINMYRYYRDQLVKWADTLNKKIRDIEFLFYLAGKKISQEEANRKKDQKE